jgi:amino acid transporter
MANERTGTKRKSCLACLLIATPVTVVALVLGFRPLVTAIEKIRNGQGLESYRTVWLVEFNYIGVVVLFVAIAIILVVALRFRWREEREWREFGRKYGVSDNDA